MEIPATSPTLSRRTRLLVSLLFLIFVTLVILIAWPIAATAPPWMFAFQTDLKYTANIVSPFLFVGFLGGLIGIAEITSTFKTYPREALKTQWAWVLILANATAAMIAMLILRATIPQMDLLSQILAVGLGFQAIIRTRFVLAKQVGAGNDGEVSVNLGWLYDQFSHLARRQIDLELMNNRRTAVTQLLEYYPTLAELYDIALYTITARETLTAEEESAKLAELERLIDPKAPEHFAKASIALVILENGGQAYVNLLLTQAMDSQTDPSPAAAPGNGDRMVRRLVDNYDLDGLVALAETLTDDARIRTYVQSAARTAPDISVAEQKATIAHFLVQQIGLELIYQKLKDLPA